MWGVGFETVLWCSPGWVDATSGLGELPDEHLLSLSKQLLREVAVRPVPVEALRQFISMAQGRRPREAASISR
jgi:hypothetical protein